MSCLIVGIVRHQFNLFLSSSLSVAVSVPSLAIYVRFFLQHLLAAPASPPAAVKPIESTTIAMTITSRSFLAHPAAWGQLSFAKLHEDNKIFDKKNQWEIFSLITGCNARSELLWN